MEIQNSAGIQDFVFQVGSEEKVNWMWQTMVPVTFTSHQRWAGGFHVSFIRSGHNILILLRADCPTQLFSTNKPANSSLS